MNDLLIYTDFVTERLLYTLKFICDERKVNFKICNDPLRFESEKDCAKLVYADYPFQENYLKVLPAKIIFEDDIHPQNIELNDFGQVNCLAFNDIIDPLASIFFVVTRYEEYMNYAPDEHDRFIANQSVLKKFDLLHKPMADIWSEALLKKIQSYYPTFTYSQPNAQLTLSFDIDNTFAFKHKNIVQLVGGRVKDFLQGNHAHQEIRRKVLNGDLPDPNDTFDQILGYAHQGIAVKVFWHLGDFKKYDRNIPWTNAVHQRLIQKMAAHITLGIHPSYASYLNEITVKQERGRLEHIIKKPVFHSRQHFLKVRFPNTFQLLHNITIKHDYSVGFADDVGFRLCTARAVPFYNLLTDEVTDLMLHPFVYMDGTLNQYLKLNPEQAKEKVAALIQEVQKHGGNFMCIWHNDTINDQGIWEGWKSVLDFTVEQFQKS